MVLLPLGSRGGLVGDVEEDLGDAGDLFQDAFGDFFEETFGEVAAGQHGLDGHEGTGDDRPKHDGALAWRTER